MSDTTEHRGWDIEDNYHEHFLDDPDVDLTDFKEGHSGAFVASLVALFVLFMGMVFMREWTKPPVLVFPTPVVQVLQKIVCPPSENCSSPAGDSHPHQRFGPLSVDLGWTLDCFRVNSGLRLIRPNYENAACNLAAAKKRGAF